MQINRTRCYYHGCNGYLEGFTEDGKQWTYIKLGEHNPGHIMFCPYHSNWALKLEEFHKLARQREKEIDYFEITKALFPDIKQMYRCYGIGILGFKGGKLEQFIEQAYLFMNNPFYFKQDSYSYHQFHIWVFRHYVVTTSNIVPHSISQTLSHETYKV